MNHRENQREAAIEREIADIRRRMSAIPATFPRNETEEYWTLLSPAGVSVLPPSSAYGVRRMISDIATIPIIAPLTSPGTLPDGVGIAYGVRTYRHAILIHDQRSRVPRDLYVGDVFSVVTGRIPVTGDPTQFQEYISAFIVVG